MFLTGELKFHNQCESSWPPVGPEVPLIWGTQRLLGQGQAQPGTSEGLETLSSVSIGALAAVWSRTSACVFGSLVECESCRDYVTKH